MRSQRQTRRTIHAASFLLLLVGLLLSACGGQSGSAQGQSQPVTLRLISTVTGAQEAPVKAAIQSFHALHPNITIQDSYDSTGTLVTTQLAAGNGPDIWMHNGGFGTIAKDPEVQAGYMADLSNQPWVAQLSAGAKSAVTYHDSKVYLAPLNTNVIGVIYNKTIFASHGVTTLPQTWGDFLQLCQKLKAAGVTPLGYGGKDGWPNFPLALAMAASSVPASFNKDLYAGTATFVNSPWLQIMKDILSLKSDMNANPTGTDWPTSAQLLASSKVAMLVQGDWAPPFVRTLSNPDLSMFTLPYVSAGSQATLTSSINRTWAVNAKSQHQKEAEEFLQFFYQESNLDAFLKQNGGLPTLTGKQVSVDPAVTSLLPLVGSSVPFASNDWPAGVEDTMDNAIQGMLAGTGVTPAQVVKDMDGKFQSVKG